MQSRRVFFISIVLFMACDESSAPASDDDAGRAPTPAEWKPVDASESYADKTLEQWAIAYKRWSLSQTTCDSPALDTDGSMCALYQDPESPVFFLEAAPSDKPRTRCQIPTEKAIAVPIMVISNDNAGVPTPLSKSDLEQSVEEVFSSIRDVKLSADGYEIDDLERWAVGPTEFNYMIPPTPNYYSCNNMQGVADTLVEPSFLAGYFVIFPAPPPGRHEMKFSAVATYADQDLPLRVTTRFLVEETHE